MARFGLELGKTGLTQYAGRVAEEWMQKLDGDRGRRVYREMADNDATIGAILFAVEMILRNVDWRVEPFSSAPDHVEQAEFVESLLDDMSHTWEDMIAEIMSFLVWGWSSVEIVYKRRVGPSETDPAKKSRHSDGLVGWRKLAPRAQETLDRWEFDDEGGTSGWWQDPPDGRSQIFLPIEKILVFRTTSVKGNPEGRSILRRAFVSYYRKKRIEEAEAIGVERDLAGMPIFYVPPELFDPNASAEQTAVLNEYRRIVENIKNDEQAGLVLPSVYDENGNKTVTFELAGTGSRRLFDTSGIIRRYDQAIAQTVLADFILLGHEKVGSFALADSKTDLFAVALGAWMKEIAAVLNRHAIPRLYALNGWKTGETATIVPGDIEKPDLEIFANAIERLTGTGWLTPGGDADEAQVRALLNLPERTDTE